MKYECQVTTYGKPKKALKSLLKNIYQAKGECFIGLMEENLSFIKPNIYNYKEDDYYCYPLSKIIKKFDKFWRYKQKLNKRHGWQDVTLMICDKFSSFEQMDSSGFDNIDNGFCFYINLLEGKFDHFKMDTERFPLDNYYFIPNAICFDICTVVKSSDDTIFEELAGFFGLNSITHQNHSDRKFELIKLKP